MQNLHGRKSHFQVFIFDLNSSWDLAFFYLDWTFAQRNGARYVTDSIPYFTVFLFSVKISLKCLILWMLGRKLKSEFIIGGTVYNFIHFGHEDLQIFLMICRLIFFPCWNSLLVSFFCMLAADPFRVLHQLSYLMV